MRWITGGAAALLALASACGGSSKPGASQPAAGEAPPPAVTEAQEIAPVAEIDDDLRELLVDLADAKLCGQVEGSIMSLSGGGEGMEQGKGKGKGKSESAPSVGMLWVRDCSAVEIDPTHVRLKLGGAGWQWVSRESEQLGAEFDVDHYARFEVDIDMTATADLAYDPDGHIATAWLLPTESVQADLRSLGNVPVDEEGLWSEIVGGAASLVGKSPSDQAEKQVAKGGTRQFERSLSGGFSVAVNLCTGRRATHLGALIEGEMPDIELDPKGQLQRSSGRVRLHDDGLMLYGPYTGASQLVARLVPVEGGAVRARLVCEDAGRAMFQAYLKGERLPEVEALATQVVQGETTSVEASGMDCPVMLALQPVKAPATLQFVVFEPGRGFEPIVDCR